jgi:hypothetical protein
MGELTLSQAQAEMRRGYLCGAPGVLVSGIVWLVAGTVAALRSPQAAVLALLAGGVVIHPVGVLLTKALGRSGSHSAPNPLGRLAAEGTFWLLAGIAVACGVSLLRLEWFFPAMLLVVGGRYLTFQTLYGLRLYWLLGGLFCAAGLALALARAGAPAAALAGGGIELLFAALLLGQAKRDAD